MVVVTCEDGHLCPYIKQALVLINIYFSCFVQVTMLLRWQWLAGILGEYRHVTFVSLSTSVILLSSVHTHLNLILFMLSDLFSRVFITESRYVRNPFSPTHASLYHTHLILICLSTLIILQVIFLSC